MSGDQSPRDHNRLPDGYLIRRRFDHYGTYDYSYYPLFLTVVGFGSHFQDLLEVRVIVHKPFCYFHIHLYLAELNYID